jgi:uncharacterized protein YqeY
MTHEDIKNSMKDAMRAKDAVRLGVLRSVASACTNALVSAGKMPQDVLPEEEVMAVISRLAKQRKDSIDQFEKGGRADLAEDEKKELAILQEFLPTLMSVEEILPYAKAKKEELGMDDKSKMGMLVGAVMKELQGKADGADVKSAVEQLFV